MLYVDVTQLYEWKGKLTGIPRVMNELSMRFESESNSALVVWSGSGFSTISYEKLLAFRQGSGLPSSPAGNSTSRIRTIAGRLARKVPTLSRVYRRFREVFKAPSVSVQAQEVSMTSGDTLLVLWGAWHSQEYIEGLEEIYSAGGVRLVQVVYDMLPFVAPQYSGHSTAWLDNYARRIYPLCSLLLAISEHTANDTAAWLKTQRLPVPPIKTIRLGDDFMAAKPTKPVAQEFKNGHTRGGDFLLMVGTIEARKNHALLYYAYKIAHERKIHLPKLVIVGRVGWLATDIFTLMSTDLDVKDKFIFLQNTSDEELTWLYKHCMFTVYASFYEGWGLPVAESVANGVPCVASNTSSIPEIAGDLISYFSPNSPEDCLNVLLETLADNKLATARNKVQNYSTTSWEETFETVSNYTRSV